jgi:DNA polymerase I-like protein with 3'-5' exonuclease and polymerase domains
MQANIHTDEDALWRYNLQDCLVTREVGEVLAGTLETLGLVEVDAFQQALFFPVLQAMLWGIRVDRQARDRIAKELRVGIEERQAFLEDVLGMPINIRSPKQMSDLFYTVLRQPPQRTRAKKGVPGHLTCDDEALKAIAKLEPLLQPVIGAIQDIRTLGVFLSTFVMARLDEDGRMRTSFNIAGNAKVEASGEQSTAEKSAPYTFRLSSSQNAFGGGCNLQNVPSDKSKSVGKAKARGMTFSLPNMRSMYIPDPGYEFFDMDLDRADLQVVVWEAEDEMLRAALRMGVDIHLLNVYAIDGQEPPPLEELVETHPKYADHRGPRKHKREFAKVFAHASNYGGGARTVAANTGRTVHEIDRAQKAWFGAHPGIRAWHERTLAQITKHHFVENRFGYRWYIFDRLDGILPEALAWVPQSTVSCLINRIWLNVYNSAPDIWVLGQGHDSLFGQYLAVAAALHQQQILNAAKVIIPYDEPLVIPAGLSVSTKSWGDCH